MATLPYIQQQQSLGALLPVLSQMAPPWQTHMSSTTQPQRWSNPEASILATSVAGAQQNLSLIPTNSVTPSEAAFLSTNPATMAALPYMQQLPPTSASMSLQQSFGALLPFLLLQAGIAAPHIQQGINLPDTTPSSANQTLQSPRMQAQGYATRVAAAAPAEPPGLTGRPPVPVYLDYDHQTLTGYQCLLRRQVELFETGPDDIRGSAQGRNTPILLGQVGIRCRHCAPLTRSARNRGAVYYSKTIAGVYQIAQNMGRLHLCNTCHKIPEDTKRQLIALQKNSNRASGGKEYWGEGLRVLGVCEDGNILRFDRSRLG
jgi:hypothetical protein